MTYSNQIKRLAVIGLASIGFYACGPDRDSIAPTLITEKVPHDSDDPAIWIHPSDPASSLVFGTDKDETDGGVYAFNLEGEILPKKSLTGLSYPNNVDIEYGLQLPDGSKTDILVFTEREKHQMRVFSIPELKPLDGGGFKVFEDEEDESLRRPMGIATFKNPADGQISVFVSRKAGPKERYIYQYRLKSDSLALQSKLLRKLGNFSGFKEIEAIAVDDELGYVYFSDEGIGIRKYHADPTEGDEEISMFGKDYFTEDIEGIAIVSKDNAQGYLIVSNQQDNSFNIFTRNENTFVKTIDLGTLETDGCDVTSTSLGESFPKGLFVSMNDERNFFFHSLDSLNLD